jgi:peptidoglycan/LPS O-acetylase OafA/YrhL
MRPLERVGITDEWIWFQIPCHLLALQAVLCKPWGADPPLWSLGYEWAFYLLTPALFILCARPYPRLPAAVLIAGICVSLSLHALFESSLAFWLPRGELAFWLAMFVAGTVAARIYDRSPMNGLLGASGLLICLGALAISRLSILPVLATDLWVAAGFALCLTSRPLMQWTAWRPFDRLIRRGAGFSYSLYLTHLPVAVFGLGLLEHYFSWPAHLVQPTMSGWLAFTALTVLAISAAWLFAKGTEDRTEAARAALVALKERYLVPAPAPQPGASAAAAERHDATPI